MQALSKAKLKLFTSLQAKKYRYRHQLFMVEGRKMTHEALSSGWGPSAVILREDALHPNVPFFSELPEENIYIASEKDFRSLSSQQNPEGVLAVVPFPRPDFSQAMPIEQLPSGQGLLIEQIQDPGNLGTLIRSADWFGIRRLYCSEGTVDLLNPKVLRASMGSVFRVELRYASNWQAMLEQEAGRIWLADMEGEKAASAPLDGQSWILLGNEANGVAPSTRQIPNIRKLSLPGKGGAESLNVAVAGGILLYELNGK